MRAKDRLGIDGEDFASRHLERLGLEILERRWRCRYGEIDLVCREGQTLVFVEVKTRRGTRFGHPFEAITAAKLRRLRELTGLYVASSEWRLRIRLDAIAVIASDTEPWQLQHLRGIG